MKLHKQQQPPTPPVQPPTPPVPVNYGWKPIPVPKRHSLDEAGHKHRE